MRYSAFLATALGIMIGNVMYLTNTIAAEKLRGVCYGPHRDNESPLPGGLDPLPSGLEQDIAFIRKVANSIRTYSVNNTAGLIPEMCEKQGLDCYPGCWIGSSAPENELEVELLIRIANKNFKHVNAVIVGNEALHRKDVSEKQLIGYVRRVKQAVNVPVAVADTSSAWLEHKQLASQVDCMMVQIYPYWEGVAIDDAANHTMKRLKEVQDAYPKARIILSEFGWPSAGEKRGAAVSSPKNQAKYIGEVLPLLDAAGVQWFYFSMFDEKWKTQQEQEVGAHWGLFDSRGSVKPDVTRLFSNRAQGGFSRLPRLLEPKSSD